MLSILVIHMKLSLFAAYNDKSRVWSPCNMLNSFIQIFAPLSTAFDPTYYDMTILVGYAYFGAIRAPFKINNSGYFSIVDHLVDPLAIVLHKYNDQPT